LTGSSLQARLSMKQLNERAFIASIKIDSVKFELKRDKSSGRMIFDLLTTYQNRNPARVKYALPIHSIWIDDIGNEAIKCFCLVKSRRSRELERVVTNFGMIASSDDTSMVLTALNGIIRYGPKPDTVMEIEDEDYSQYNVYYSKQQLVLAILESIRINGIPNAGFDSANLNLIPDSLLLAFGFRTIDDYFSRSPVVWIANISSIINPENRYYDRASIRSNALSLINVISKIIERE